MGARGARRGACPAGVSVGRRGPAGPELLRQGAALPRGQLQAQRLRPPRPGGRRRRVVRGRPRRPSHCQGRELGQPARQSGSALDRAPRRAGDGQAAQRRRLPRGEAALTLGAGERLGPFEILELLGRGGMGAVYKAFDPALNRTVALKVLPSEFLDDASFGDRFQREVRIWASLDHPAVVPVYMAGIEAGRPFFAMKYVAGGTLADRLKRNPPSLQRSFALLADVAVALDYAHSRGIVHRDVKPANVLLEEDGG